MNIFKYLVFALFFVNFLNGLICQFCKAEGKPVCADDGVEYPSKCHAMCDLKFKYRKGKCFGFCDCLDEYLPVCGDDGVTYENSCMAECSEADISYDGVCRCDCPEYVDTVCGMDGMNYMNPCFAACENVGVRYLAGC